MNKQNCPRPERYPRPSFGLRPWLAAVGLAVLGVAAIAPGQSSRAAESTGCFMVDASGKTISLGALCGYAVPAPGGVGGSAAGQNSRVVQVPIVRRSGRTPVIAVTFNGQKTYEMILDTGASGTLITSKMAAELKLQPNGFVQAEIADGSLVQFATSRVKSIAVKNAKVDNVDVAIATDTDIGLLGHDFFGDFDIRIGEKTVEFIRR